jgi:cellulose synthase/poly-beta-1,6-N-acetylglucosamine synthase-like glycosyltransferase
VRNEEAVILKSLKSLLEINYPKSLFECILINDHSTDNTARIIHEFLNEHPEFPGKLMDMSLYPELQTKKEAITYGVDKAKFDWIILTDGDCTRSENWLMALNEIISNQSCKMIYAPVQFSSDKIFEHLQALEFMGLVGIGASAIRMKNPNMCSAANLAFRKEVFFEVGGYTDNKHIASGDDEFLLHKVFKKYPNEVYFLKDLRALVSTSANASMEQLTSQRRRWVSKSTSYDNRYITAILVAAYLFNLSILLNFILAYFSNDFLIIAIVQIGLKALIEGLFLFDVLKFFQRKYLILYLLLAEPFHIIYVIVIGIWANFSAYNWKGRIHN